MSASRGARSPLGLDYPRCMRGVAPATRVLAIAIACLVVGVACSSTSSESPLSTRAESASLEGMTAPVLGGMDRQWSSDEQDGHPQHVGLLVLVLQRGNADPSGHSRALCKAVPTGRCRRQPAGFGGISAGVPPVGRHHLHQCVRSCLRALPQASSRTSGSGSAFDHRGWTRSPTPCLLPGSGDLQSTPQCHQRR